MGLDEECGLEPEGSGEPWERLNSAGPQSSLFIRKISLAVVRGETRGRRPGDEAVGFQYPFCTEQGWAVHEAGLIP